MIGLLEVGKVWNLEMIPPRNLSILMPRHITDFTSNIANLFRASSRPRMAHPSIDWASFKPSVIATSSDIPPQNGSPDQLKNEEHDLSQELTRRPQHLRYIELYVLRWLLLSFFHSDLTGFLQLR